MKWSFLFDYRAELCSLFSLRFEGAGVIALLSACASFSPVTYDCSNLVSAPEVGARIVMATETGQPAQNLRPRWNLAPSQQALVRVLFFFAVLY